MKSETKNQKNENEINKQETIKIKYERSINYKRDNLETEDFWKNDYNPDKKELYKRHEDGQKHIKEGKELLDYRYWKNKNKKQQATAKLFNFESGRGFENFKFEDKKAKQLKKENDINGVSEKKQFRTMKKFTAAEVAAKTFFMQKLTSSKENRLKVAQMQEDYNLEIYDKIIKKAKDEGLINNKGEVEGESKYVRDALLAKDFFDNYEILESTIEDKTKMSAWVVGNKKNKTIEVFFGGSNNPSGLIIDTKTNIDWTNDGRAVFQTPPNYKAANEFVTELMERYEQEKNKEPFKKYNRGIEAVNGFSKGGGEAIYVASRKNLKALVVDPAPVINPGMFVNNDKILALVPGNGEGLLNRANPIIGAPNLYVLEQKAGISEGRGKSKTSLIPAIPVPPKGNAPFDNHFADVYSVKDSFEKTEKYISKIKEEHYAYFGGEDLTQTGFNSEELKKKNEEKKKEILIIK